MLKFAASEKCRPAEAAPPAVKAFKKPRMHNDENEDAAIKLLFENFKSLKKAQDDFQNFLEVVSKDITSKTESLKKIKGSGQASISNKADANVQLFMLGQYRHRIARFSAVSSASLHNISSKLMAGEQVEAVVTKHMAITAKMKRRMKQMLDVTEKYAVEEIFETINLLQQMSNKMKLAPVESGEERARRLGRRSQSLTVLADLTNSPASRRSLSPIAEGARAAARVDVVDGEGGAGQGRRMNSLKSFSDHLAVLTKTYTNRR